MATKQEVETPPLSNSSLVTISTIATAKVAMGKPMVAEMQKVCDNIKSFEITDNAQLTVFKEQLTQLNKVVKLIETRRIELKAPYLSSGNMIDDAAKELKGEAETVITEGKRKMMVYLDEAAKKAEEETQLAEIEAAKKLKESQKNADAKREELQLRAQFMETVIKGFSLATTMDLLKKHYTEALSSAKKLPFDDEEQKKTFCDDIIRLKDKQKVTIENIEKAKSSGDSRAALIAKQKAELEALEEQERIQAQADEEDKNVLAQQQQEEELAKAEIVGVEVSSKVDMQTRDSITFEVVKPEMVPAEWMMLDESKVKEFIKSDRQLIKNGSIINGIKFTITKSPVLR